MRKKRLSSITRIFTFSFPQRNQAHHQRPILFPSWQLDLCTIQHARSRITNASETIRTSPSCSPSATPDNVQSERHTAIFVWTCTDCVTVPQRPAKADRNAVRCTNTFLESRKVSQARDLITMIKAGKRMGSAKWIYPRA